MLVICACALVFASSAEACIRDTAPLTDRLDRADAAVVARVVTVKVTIVKGARQRLLTLDVDQHVKGSLPKEVVVRSPLPSQCGVRVRANKAQGFLLTKGAGGVWLATSSSIVDPGRLVVAGGEPRGWPIKVGIGLVILGAVLLWSLRRLRRGTRPYLPGAPLLRSTPQERESNGDGRKLGP